VLRWLFTLRCVGIPGWCPHPIDGDRTRFAIICLPQTHRDAASLGPRLHQPVRNDAEPTRRRELSEMGSPVLIRKF
jgi:hypothetical protein